MLMCQIWVNFYNGWNSRCSITYKWDGHIHVLKDFKWKCVNIKFDKICVMLSRQSTCLLDIWNWSGICLMSLIFWYHNYPIISNSFNKPIKLLVTNCFSLSFLSCSNSFFILFSFLIYFLVSHEREGKKYPSKKSSSKTQRVTFKGDV